MSSEKLARAFYMGDVKKAARELLGRRFVRTDMQGRRMSGRIVETEAYAGEHDPASHAYRGRTARNAVMFMPGGHLYVYFTYGMHYCCNVVTGREGEGEAVLIRALEPLEGIDEMIYRRYGKMQITDRQYKNLCNGPAKLCRALGIDREANGGDLCEGEYHIEKGMTIPDKEIVSSARIGIRTGLSLPWRFYIKDNKWVSK